MIHTEMHRVTPDEMKHCCFGWEESVVSEAEVQFGESVGQNSNSYRDAVHGSFCVLLFWVPQNELTYYGTYIMWLGSNLGPDGFCPSGS